MPRLNGVKAIMEYLGYKSRSTWRHLVTDHGLPHYRDREDSRRVWAKSEELDAWDEAQSIHHGQDVN